MQPIAFNVQRAGVVRLFADIEPDVHRVVRSGHGPLLVRPSGWSPDQAQEADIHVTKRPTQAFGRPGPYQRSTSATSTR